MQTKKPCCAPLVKVDSTLVEQHRDHTDCHLQQSCPSDTQIHQIHRWYHSLHETQQNDHTILQTQTFTILDDRKPH